MHKNTLPPPSESTCRLDKWLWCARFYRTRALAAVAIRTGKVEVNGARVKPARTIAPGDRLRVRRGPLVHEITVLATATARRSAAEAAAICAESPESARARELLQARLDTDRERYPRTHGRPGKRDRRALVRFKQRGT